MKIAIDISQVVYSATGVARYTNYLIEALTKYDKENDYIFFISTLRGRLSKDTRELLKNQIVKRFYLPPAVLDLLWNRLHIFPFENFVGPIDLVITSDWTEPPVRSAKKVTVIHDMIAYLYPETSTQTSSFDIKSLQFTASIIKTMKRRLSWVKKESNLIIADSASTKKDIIKIFAINDERVKVIYPAVEIKKIESNNSTSVIKKYNLNKPFILSVGKLEPRKNLLRLTQAFEKIEAKNIELVIVGPKGWGDEILAYKKPNIKLLGHITDEDLYSLYSQAICFVMPSIYEGFGYPLVEAMTLGCPVVTSNVSSMREIAQDSGLLFDPLSVNSIARSLNQLVTNNQLRNDLISKGRTKAQFFRLNRFANEFVSALSLLK